MERLQTLERPLPQNRIVKPFCAKLPSLMARLRHKMMTNFGAPQKLFLNPHAATDADIAIAAPQRRESASPQAKFSSKSGLRRRLARAARTAPSLGQKAKTPAHVLHRSGRVDTTGEPLPRGVVEDRPPDREALDH